MTTTDPEPPAAGNRLGEHLRSVRTRITSWVIVLTGLALAVVGVAIYLVESQRLDERTSDSITQEMTEFEQLRDQGIDPDTGRDFSTARRLMEVALERNAPERHEVLLAVLPDGSALLGNEEGALAGVDRSQMLAAIDAEMPEGGFSQLDTDAGTLVFAVKPVRDGDNEGAYVVAFFRDRVQADVTRTVATYAVVATVALLLVAVGAWLTAGRLLRPIRDLRDTAREISDTDLSRRITVTGADDLSDLARTFNAMLDRLQTSFALQRRFLDDAGHELRTPITIVRGHLEVADRSNAEDIATTHDLVLDEVDRMSRLVDDLVVLAKAGQPDFVRPTDVDVAALTDHVLQKVAALGDRDWALDERAEVVTKVDPQRITQALVQLAKNAVQHTHDGDLVAIGSSATDGQVSWWVRDTGPGVARPDAERIFDRFQRGHQARGHDGSGLGLSIVKAITEAHGGDVLLDSEPGKGATFTITVPLSEEPA